MNQQLFQIVHPVFRQGLQLYSRLRRGEEPVLEEEQAILMGLLAEQPVPDFLPDPDGRFLGIRYVLVCWVDELFILESPWASRWAENKLEARLYGSNERAFRFWEQADLAVNRPTTDALETCFICVLLGFSGERGEDPALLHAWLSSTRLQLRQKRETSWVPPPGLEPETFVPLLEGRRSLHTALLVGVLVFLALIPAVALLMVRQGV
jgi:type VI secretion system protein ImpK